MHVIAKSVVKFCSLVVYIIDLKRSLVRGTTHFLLSLRRVILSADTKYRFNNINARRHEISIFPLHLNDYVFSLRELFTRKFLLPQKYNQDE